LIGDAGGDGPTVLVGAESHGSSAQTIRWSTDVSTLRSSLTPAVLRLRRWTLPVTTPTATLGLMLADSNTTPLLLGAVAALLLTPAGLWW
jgi:hypothetical protein